MTLMEPSSQPSCSSSALGTDHPFWGCDDSNIWINDSDDDDDVNRVSYSSQSLSEQNHSLRSSCDSVSVPNSLMTNDGAQNNEEIKITVADSSVKLTPVVMTSSNNNVEDKTVSHQKQINNENKGSPTAFPTKVNKMQDVSNPNQRPLDVRPKVFEQNKRKLGKKESDSYAIDTYNTESLTTKTRLKKKNKTKVRVKKNKKWRLVNPVDIGLHISSLSSSVKAEPEDIGLPIRGTFNSNATHETDSNNMSMCVDIGVLQDTTGHHTMTTEKSSNETLQCQSGNVMDDEAYFTSLGIDISYSGPYEPDINDWDGLIFLHKCHNEIKTNTTRKGIGTKVKPSFPDSTTKTDFKNNHRFDIPTLSNLSNSEKFKLFELECSSSKKICLRKDRDNRIQKAHKSIKSKHCTSILNNKGRKKLFMHHRLYKKLDPQLDLSSPPPSRYKRIPPMPKGIQVKDITRPVQRPPYAPRPAPVQNLKYAIDQSNAPREMENQLSSFLISLQHRELTPEDYDMLLRLDDSVKPKTVGASILASLKTETVPESGLELICAVCMELYIAGQKRKFLPCGHDFHSDCIDTWLKNSSMNCPLDGLPVDS